MMLLGLAKCVRNERRLRRLDSADARVWRPAYRGAKSSSIEPPWIKSQRIVVYVCVSVCVCGLIQERSMSSKGVINATCTWQLSPMDTTAPMTRSCIYSCYIESIYKRRMYNGRGKRAAGGALTMRQAIFRAVNQSFLQTRMQTWGISKVLDSSRDRE